MRYTRLALILICIVFYQTTKAQQPAITILDSGHKTSIRGLSVVSDEVVWVSGSNGTVARSINGGNSFEWLKVDGYEKRDFRDIEAFDANTAIIMGVDAPAVILKTKDGGKSWAEVFRDTTKGMFLDAMDFNGKTGIVVGDPLNDYIFVAYTKDGGDHWYKADAKGSNIKVEKDEAFFASSGTNVKLLTDKMADATNFYLVSGGSRARLIFGQQLIQLPIMQGGTSQGANSIAVMGSRAVVVGGDFAHDTISRDNCVLFKTGQKNFTFSIPETSPHGYRSCIAFITQNKLITCGTSGIDLSSDGGNNWRLISRQSFHVCQRARHGTAVFLAGGNGKIGKLVQ